MIVQSCLPFFDMFVGQVLTLPMLRFWFGPLLTQVSSAVSGLQKEALREISLDILDEVWLCQMG